MSFAVIDLETTGLDPETDRVIEIAVLTADATFHSLVNPHCAIGASHIHGISQADVTQAPRFNALLSSLIPLLKGRAIVAHNVAFDLAFINAEFARSGYPMVVPRDVGVCTMNQSRIYLPDGSHSLPACLERAGIPYSRRHRAEADAMGARSLLEYYLEHETTGRRVTNHATDRHGQSVLPAEWDRAMRVAADITWPCPT